MIIPNPTIGGEGREGETRSDDACKTALSQKSIEPVEDLSHHVHDNRSLNKNDNGYANLVDGLGRYGGLHFGSRALGHDRGRQGRREPHRTTHHSQQEPRGAVSTRVWYMHKTQTHTKTRYTSRSSLLTPARMQWDASVRAAARATTANAYDTSPAQTTPAASTNKTK